jgi:Icc-related predicted phosphoesterase
LISNATVLINEGVEVAGLKIWGSPTTPLLGAAFGVTSPSDRANLYAKIPRDVNILVTHGPPYGILDRTPGTLHHAGCPQLLDAVSRLKPKLHVFGHVHGAHGMVSTDDTLFLNAALLGSGGDLGASPLVLRIPRA